jgi:hypothetical protein
VQRSRFPLLLASLLFCAHTFAQQSANVWVIPPSPTNETPITIGVLTSCAFGAATATVNGNVITVDAPRQMCNPPSAELQYAKLPQLLAPGQYRIEAPGIGTRTFIVRDAEPKPFEVHPYAVPANAPPAGALQLTLQAGTLGTPLCPAGNCTVTVGGAAAPVRAFSNDAVRVEAPRLPPGLYDVTLTRGGTTTTVPRAVVYFNRLDPPDPTVFERILFPVLFNTRGQHGSDWRTEAVISNPKPWFVEFYNDVTSIVCVTYPCGERIGPMITTRFEGGRHPGGIALLAPWPEAEQLAFALRVRDVSREAESFGTDIPVVRESQMFRDTDLTFLDVPFDARYRAKLRVYAFDPFRSNAPPFIGVRTDPPSPFGPGIGPTGLVLTRNCSPTTCYAAPMYGEMELQLGGAARADVYLDTESVGGSPVWAFITVTNNETQQVTIITPNGKGGEPCKSDCREDH